MDLFVQMMSMPHHAVFTLTFQVQLSRDLREHQGDSELQISFARTELSTQHCHMAWIAIVKQLDALEFEDQLLQSEVSDQVGYCTGGE
jgi:hypothetical protein